MAKGELRPSVDLAIEEAKREWPSSRYWRLTNEGLGVAEVYDRKTQERVATVYGMTDEKDRF